MATNRPLKADLKVTGMDQASMYAWMANVTDAVNELMDDHATFITLTTANKAAINAVIAAALDTGNGISGVTTVSAAAVATLSDTTDLTLYRS